MAEPMPDDDLLEGCDLDFREHVMDDADAELFVLFAEALDPASPRTVDEVAGQWKELFS